MREFGSPQPPFGSGPHHDLETFGGHAGARCVQSVPSSPRPRSLPLCSPQPSLRACSPPPSHNSAPSRLSTRRRSPSSLRRMRPRRSRLLAIRLQPVRQPSRYGVTWEITNLVDTPRSPAVCSPVHPYTRMGLCSDLQSFAEGTEHPRFMSPSVLHPVRFITTLSFLFPVSSVPPVAVDCIIFHSCHTFHARGVVIQLLFHTSPRDPP